VCYITRTDRVLPTQSMREDSFTLTLFYKDSVDSRSNGGVQRHIGEARLGESSGQKAGQLSAGLHDGYRPSSLAGRPGLEPGLGLIDQVSELLRKFCMTLPGSLSCHLHRDRIETLVIALGVTTNQRFDVIGGCHLFAPRTDGVEPVRRIRQVSSAHPPSSVGATVSFPCFLK
jgi:hypothetical protein